MNARIAFRCFDRVARPSAFELEAEPIGQLHACLSDGAVLALHDQVQDISATALTDAVDNVLLDIHVKARAILAAVNGASTDQTPWFLLVESAGDSVAGQNVPDRHLVFQGGEIDPPCCHLVPSYVCGLTDCVKRACHA